MLSNLFGAITKVVSTGADVIMEAGDAIIEDIKKIPEAVEEGWNDSYLKSTEESTKVEEKETETKVEEKSLFNPGDK